MFPYGKLTLARLNKLPINDTVWLLRTDNYLQPLAGPYLTRWLELALPGTQLSASNCSPAKALHYFARILTQHGKVTYGSERFIKLSEAIFRAGLIKDYHLYNYFDPTGCYQELYWIGCYLAGHNITRRVSVDGRISVELLDHLTNCRLIINQQRHSEDFVDLTAVNSKVAAASKYNSVSKYFISKAIRGGVSFNNTTLFNACLEKGNWELAIILYKNCNSFCINSRTERYLFDAISGDVESIKRSLNFDDLPVKDMIELAILLRKKEVVRLLHSDKIPTLRFR